MATTKTSLAPKPRNHPWKRTLYRRPQKEAGAKSNANAFAETFMVAADRIEGKPGSERDDL